MVFMMEQSKPSINGYEASIVASSLTNLLPKETRGEAWVLTALQAASKFVLAELDDENTSSKSKQRAAEVLIPLARSFLVVDSFDDELFRRLFEVINAGGLGNTSLPGFKRRLLQSKMYQVHLDCKLNDRASEFRLSPALEKEYQHVFDTLENQAKGSSFRLHHLVSNALDEIGFVNDVSFDTETGYHLDVVAPKEKIAIEINTAECYQTVEPGHEDQDPKTLGYVDLKARHLELLGWTVIQLNARNFQQLETQEERVMHLSMLLEVATNFKQKPATQAARTLARVKKHPKKNPHPAALLERQR
ncbi:hypothetical protein BBJ28_00012340 [Nothophytophthora sp. Chile5]|nr:hypothetical protein BBJ28_00012340 [Nothophytophthora sp. Chile5]